MDIVKHTYAIASLLPESEKFGLKSQITRAAVSVPSNIAEGSAKTSDKEFRVYLESAMGSLFELETQLLLINELDMVGMVDLKELLAKINEEQKMLNSFITVVKSRYTKTGPNPKS